MMSDVAPTAILVRSVRTRKVGKGAGKEQPNNVVMT